MSWLLRHNWLWEALAFLLGAVITWILLIRRDPRMVTPATAGVGTTPLARTAPEPTRPKADPPTAKAEPPTAKVETPTAKDEPPAPKVESRAPKAASPAPKAASPAPKAEAATLFDVQAEDKKAAVVGPYGPGSMAALADGSAPDGYPVKGNTQSMLFHTTDSPYYGRTKPEVWFRTEADAAAAGFTKYERRRKK